MLNANNLRGRLGGLCRFQLKQPPYRERFDNDFFSFSQTGQIRQVSDLMGI